MWDSTSMPLNSYRGILLRPPAGSLVLPFALFPDGVQADEVIGTPGDGAIFPVRPADGIISKQRLRPFVGISGANSGARGLWLCRVVIPPAMPDEPTTLSTTEPAVAIMARNDPQELEQVPAHR
jgi:hypothetical protein